MSTVLYSPALVREGCGHAGQEHALPAMFGDPAGNSTALGHDAVGTGGREQAGRVQLLSAIMSLAERLQ